jgi:coenzyme Q-binding protein COQ10
MVTMQKIITVICLSILSLTVAAYAADTPENAAAPEQQAVAEPAPAPTPGPITKKLSAAELVSIKVGKVILRSKTNEQSESGSGYAIGFINATPDQIWDTILDYDKYAEFQPRITECKKTLHKGNRVDAHFTLDMDITDIEYDIIHTFHPLKNRLTWVLDTSKPADYLTATTGYYQVEALPDGGSLIEYSVVVDLEISVPGVGYVVRKVAKYVTGTDLPNVIKLLKKRVESGNTWKK